MKKVMAFTFVLISILGMTSCTKAIESGERVAENPEVRKVVEEACKEVCAYAIKHVPKYIKNKWKEYKQNEKNADTESSAELNFEHCDTLKTEGPICLGKYVKQ